MLEVECPSKFQHTLPLNPLYVGVNQLFYPGECADNTCDVQYNTCQTRTGQSDEFEAHDVFTS